MNRRYQLRRIPWETRHPHLGDAFSTTGDVASPKLEICDAAVNSPMLKLM
jgi:hypothetical protein